ncbi:alpha-(1,3)-fucosyltransferase C [Aplysia californica]|uniref:Fucosyltransferase n=1 Tax=Aplysia californica TaxID=6500 RepID=A0ABM0JID6_APLCA|nr:alpha-(1,3)-fucosyltransferase C [Aplysia californica]
MLHCPPHENPNSWVLKTDEAPSRFTWLQSLNRTGLKEQFNWTITHKLNSDIVQRYGYLVARDSVPVKDYDKIYNGKSKTVVWFVSHCPVRSRRKGYVQKMKVRTDVDIFGMCGDLSCGTAPKGPGIVGLREKADVETCFPMLSEKYKFYLAFENSLCQEYVTEKFFKLFNDVDVIPVVRGGADYKSYFPPKTFVDASDFSTPEALADFLEDLGRDRERYIQYLKNKDRWRSVRDFPQWQCKLCEKLHTDRNRKRYANVHSWWVYKSCHDDVIDSLKF